MQIAKLPEKRKKQKKKLETTRTILGFMLAILTFVSLHM